MKTLSKIFYHELEHKRKSKSVVVNAMICDKYRVKSVSPYSDYWVNTVEFYDGVNDPPLFEVNKERLLYK